MISWSRLVRLLLASPPIVFAGRLQLPDDDYSDGAHQYVHRAYKKRAGKAIQDAVQQTVDIGSMSVSSGRFTLAQIEQDGIYSGCAKAALLDLFGLLANWSHQKPR